MIRGTMTGDSSSRGQTRCATRPGSRARIDTAGCAITPMAVRRPTDCGHCCGVVLPRITRGSWRPEHGWRGISRPRFIPARSRARVKAIATRRISIMRGRSLMRSARWESRRSIRRVERVAWAEALSQELIRRQRGDGTWTNRFTASKEDDPLVATSFAAGALAICRSLLD